MRLLNAYGIKGTLTSYHEHNKMQKGTVLLNRLKSGKCIALVSDAGTPAISDPGEDLVRLAAENGITISPIPGASALLAALVVSGLVTGRFIFEGFLPMTNKERQQRLEGIQSQLATMILYEAPHKLKNTLSDLEAVLGDRKIVLARELTKKYEEIHRTTLSESVRYYKTHDPKGEYVLILEGKPENQVLQEQAEVWQDYTFLEHLAVYTDQGMQKKEAMKQMAKDRQMHKREIYSRILDEQKQL